MSTDPERIQCVLQNDSRLVAGASAIISHAAHQANLASDAEASLAATVAKTCQTIFQSSGETAGPVLTILLGVESWPDHIEVTIEFAGEQSREALSLVDPEQFPPKMPSSSSNGRKPLSVDRVNCETVHGRSRLTLIKYSRPEPSSVKH